MLRHLLAIAIIVTVTVPGSAMGKESGLEQFGFTSDEKGLRACLDTFHYSSEMQKQIREWLRELDHDDFGVRHRATTELSKLPVIRPTLLRTELDDAAPDEDVRLRQVLATATQDRLEEILMESATLILDNSWTGYTKPFSIALEGIEIRATSVRERCSEALSTTSTKDDADLLREILKSPSPIVREGATDALIRVSGSDAIEALLPLAKDPDGRVKIKIADLLASNQRRECLSIYADILLTAEVFKTRWASANTLREITGQHFDYYAAALASQRAAPAKKWQQWVEKNGSTAPLKFSSAVVKLVDLFTGKESDRSHWKPWAGSDVPPLSDDKPMPKLEQPDPENAWAVEDEKLVTVGTDRCHFYTVDKFLSYNLELEWRTPEKNGRGGVGLCGNNDGYLEIALAPAATGDARRVGVFKCLKADKQPLGLVAPRLQPGEKVRPNEWCKVEIQVNNRRVRVVVDGVLQNLVSECPEALHRICLSNKGTRIEFRSIKLTPRQ